MSEPQVSVVMGVRGGAGLLAESLDSVLGQQGVAFELVLVVDGALDDEAEAVLAARADARLRILRQAPAGLTRALIAGCEAARGDYLARIDVGDRMHAERLARQAAVLDRHPDCVLTTCSTAVCGPAWEPLWVNRGAPADGAPGHPMSLLGTDPESGLAGDIPHHGSTMFRRSAYQSVGGYRADFYYGQDWDLWYRLAERGTYCLLPELLYSVRLFPDGISMRKWRQQRMIAECSRGAFVARRKGMDETVWLERARAIRPSTGAAREPPGLPGLWSAGDGHYFIGEALRRNGDRRARGYLLGAVRCSPLNPRPWVRLIQSFLTPA